MWLLWLTACVREGSVAVETDSSQVPQDSGADTSAPESGSDVIYGVRCAYVDEVPVFTPEEGLQFTLEVRIPNTAATVGTAWLEIWREGPSRVELHPFPGRWNYLLSGDSDPDYIAGIRLTLTPAVVWTSGETTRMEDCGPHGGTMEETVVWQVWQEDRFDCVANGPKAEWIAAERGCRVDVWGWQ